MQMTDGMHDYWRAMLNTKGFSCDFKGILHKSISKKGLEFWSKNTWVVDVWINAKILKAHSLKQQMPLEWR